MVPRAPKLRIIDLWRSRRGNTAAEFALVLPLMLFLSLGAFNLFTLMYGVTSLHFTVEDAARCASVKTDICTGPASTATYAKTQYRGPLVGMDYVVVPASADNCGNQVTGSGTFLLVTGIKTFFVPISATACYPGAN